MKWLWIRRALGAAALIVVLAIAGRARDHGAPGRSLEPIRPEGTTVEGARTATVEELALRVVRATPQTRTMPAPTRSETPRRPLPALRAHLLDPCTEPVDPAPPIPEGFEQRYVGAHVHLAWAPGTLDTGRVAELGRWVDEGIELAAAVTDTEPRERVTLVVYDTRESFREAHDLPEWVHGVYDGAIRTGADVRNLRQVLRHEATHAQLHEAIGCVPTWLNEGLAKYAQGTASDVVEPWIEQIRGEGAIPFERLGAGTLVGVADDEVEAHYAQSLAMVLWLEKSVGIPDAADRMRRERMEPEHVWPALMPEETTGDYIRFLVDHLRLPDEGGCMLRVDDVESIRCLTPAEERAVLGGSD